MTDCNDRYETTCKGEFEEINTKLDRLDVAIRGNGKPGIQVRLDRLEGKESLKTRLVWLLLGAVAMGVIGYARDWISAAQQIGQAIGQ